MSKRFAAVLLAVFMFTSGLFIGAQNASLIPAFRSGQILTAVDQLTIGDAVKDALILVGLVQDETIGALSTDHLTVVDVNGTKVGETIGVGIDGAPLISMIIESEIFVVGVSEYRFFTEYQGTGLLSRLYWDGLNCTGTPLIVGSANTILPNVRVNIPGNTIYLEDDDDEERQGLSYLVAEGKDCLNPSLIHSGVPATPLIDLNTLFTPPFTVVAK